MREIALTKGFVALVDDEDYEGLMVWRWHVAGCADSGFYARRSTKRGGENKKFYMHRQILGATDGQIVDHIDGNSMNNCRCNLRFADVSKNNFNKRKHKGKLPYKGVVAKRGKFYAEIFANGRRTATPVFSSIEEAARAYDKLAQAHHGEFARLNFPNEPCISPG